MDATLETERLTLRPLRLDDAATIQRLCGNWNVARMLSPVPHPYPDGLAEQWLSRDAECRVNGEAFRFGVDHQAELIGIVGLERKEPPEPKIFELGYWLGEPWWGRGLATEGARRVVAFAFEELAAEQLVSGHFQDNPASGQVLAKCGFRQAGSMMLWSDARGQDSPANWVVLERGWFESLNAGGGMIVR